LPLWQAVRCGNGGDGILRRRSHCPQSLKVRTNGGLRCALNISRKAIDDYGELTPWLLEMGQRCGSVPAEYLLERFCEFAADDEAAFSEGVMHCSEGSAQAMRRLEEDQRTRFTGRGCEGAAALAGASGKKAQECEAAHWKAGRDEGRDDG
jgi:hypothetical protein